MNLGKTIPGWRTGQRTGFSKNTLLVQTPSVNHELRVWVVEKKRQLPSKKGDAFHKSGQSLTAMDELSDRERDRLYETHPVAQQVIPAPRKVKFEVYGEEMIEKEVKYSGNSGRVYLPPEWVGKQIKVIRIN